MQPSPLWGRSCRRGSRCCICCAPLCRGEKVAISDRLDFVRIGPPNGVSERRTTNLSGRAFSSLVRKSIGVLRVLAMGARRINRSVFFRKPVRTFAQWEAPRRAIHFQPSENCRSKTVLRGHLNLTDPIPKGRAILEAPVGLRVLSRLKPMALLGPRVVFGFLRPAQRNSPDPAKIARLRDWPRSPDHQTTSDWRAHVLCSGLRCG